MRYFELIENYDSASAQIDAQKKHAELQLKSAKRAKEKAKAADLRLKQKQTQDALAKINRQK